VSEPGNDRTANADSSEVLLSALSLESPGTALVRTSSPTLGLAREGQPGDPAPGHDNDCDEVIGLRAWGTSRIVPLRTLSDSRRVTSTSTTALHEVTTTSTNALQRAQDALAMASHGVELICDGPWWRMRDRDGIAQLKQDGRPTREASLMPGTEISLAGLTLIAESARSIVLRNFLARLLGWSDDRGVVLDQALRAIRLANSGRATLVLRGSGDLVLVAHAVHRRTLGDLAPFVVSDPRRQNMPATVRGPRNVALGVEAFRQAAHGTLCVRTQRLPPDFDDVLRLFRDPDSAVQLIVCAGVAVSGRDAFALGAAPIEIPSLATRRAELPGIVREYLEDAIDALHAPAACVDSDTIQWIIGRASLSADITIPDIEKAAVRSVALRMTGDLTTAAAVLGMARVSLERWLTRRK
jgi:hypothetical protein